MKNRIKKIIIFMLVIILSTGGMLGLNYDTVKAIDIEAIVIDNLEYKVNNNDMTVEVIGTFGDKNTIYEITIPETITYNDRLYKVSKIGYFAIWGLRNLNTLFIPKTIEEIDEKFLGACGYLSNLNVDEENQFYSSRSGSLFNKEQTILIACQAPIESYILPDSVQEIKSDNVFYLNDSIKEIILHKDVCRLPESPFQYVRNLENIEVDGDNPNYFSENGILYSKDKTQIMCFPPSKQMDSYELPETITVFYADAISNTKFLKELRLHKNVIIYDSIDRILGVTGLGSWINYGLEKISVDKDNDYYCDIDGVLFNKDCTKLLLYPVQKLDEIYTIPDSVTKIGDWAFAENKKLKEIHIGDSVNEIGNSAFDVSSISKIYIGKNVSKINDCAFLHMMSLKKIFINSNPDNITCGKPLLTYGIPIVVPDEYYEKYIELLEGLTVTGSSTVIKKSMDNNEAEKYVVTFDTQGGNIINPITVASGSAIVLPQPVKPNNKFDGWYEDLQFTKLIENGTIINKDITLYAKWLYEGSYSSNDDSWTNTSNDTNSWNDVTNQIKNTNDGDIVEVKMNGTTILPKSVLEEIRGKDIGIKLEFTDYTWSINGKNIANNLTDINFYVHRLRDFELDDEIISNSTGYDNFDDKFMLDLSHNGDFGCNPVLNVNVGETNATYANLYYVNEDTKQLEFQQSSKIKSDNTVDFKFSHASKYVVILSDTPIENLDIKEPAITKKIKTYTNKKVDLQNKIENLEEEATVTYKSSNNAIATVSKDGIIKAKKSGTAVITIKIKQNTKEYKITTKIQVNKPYIKIVKKPSSSMKVGKTYILSCKAYGTGKSITYSSSNKKVLTIDKNGKIKAKKTGKAVITIKSGKYVKKVTLKVR